MSSRRRATKGEDLRYDHSTEKIFSFFCWGGDMIKREIKTADYADLSTGRKTVIKERSSKIIFTTIGSNVAIWLANLPPPIRIKKTLLAPRCLVMVKHWRNRFIWLHYRGWKQSDSGLLRFVAVCSLMSPQRLDHFDDKYCCRKSSDHAKPLSIC